MKTLTQLIVGTMIFFLSWLAIWVLFAGIYWLAMGTLTYSQAFHSSDIAPWVAILGFIFAVMAVVAYGVDVSENDL